MQVLGCHSKTVGEVGSCRDQYPAENGTRCLCYGTYGPYEYKTKIAFAKLEVYPSTLSQREIHQIIHSTDTDAEHMCIATCASGIQGHTIRHSEGTGLVSADCAEGTTVLGCGSATPTDAIGGNSTNATDGVVSARRIAVVTMGKSCRCYDDYRVRCYAICGVTTSARYEEEAGQLSAVARIYFGPQHGAVILCVLILLVILSKLD